MDLLLALTLLEIVLGTIGICVIVDALRPKPKRKRKPALNKQQ